MLKDDSNYLKNFKSEKINVRFLMLLFCLFAKNYLKILPPPPLPPPPFLDLVVVDNTTA